MKKCIKCGENKTISQFYIHKQMKDGHLNKCKDCCKKDVKKNYRNNIDHYREYEKLRAMLPHRVKARKLYEATENGKESVARSRNKYLESNPIKRLASHVVNNAVRDGKITKPTSCEKCGATPKRLHGHHDDYAHPLDVRWLCPGCHTKWHKENGPGLNG